MTIAAIIIVFICWFTRMSRFTTEVSRFAVRVSRLSRHIHRNPESRWPTELSRSCLKIRQFGIKTTEKRDTSSRALRALSRAVPSGPRPICHGPERDTTVGCYVTSHAYLCCPSRPLIVTGYGLVAFAHHGGRDRQNRELRSKNQRPVDASLTTLTESRQHSPGLPKNEALNIMKCALCGIESCENISLSPRLAECLTYLAKGFTIDEAAVLMNTTRDTIKDYRKRIYQKLDVGSIAEASAMAVKIGLPV